MFPMRIVPPKEPGGHPGKTPLTPHGYKDACTEEAVVRGWWRDFPDALIAVPTGTASGLLVIDIDGEKGLESWKNLASELGFDPFGTATEKSGGGLHLYYAFPSVPGRTVKSRDGWLPNVDLKAQRGSIIISPSRYVFADADGNSVRKEYAPHPEFGDRDIAMLPDALRRRILELPCIEDDPDGGGAEPSPTLETSPRGRMLLNAECRKIREVQKGTRTTTLFRSAARLANYAAGGCIRMEELRESVLAAARDSGLEEEKIFETMENAIRRGCETPKNFGAASMPAETPPPENGEEKPEEREAVSVEAPADAGIVNRLPDFPEEFVPEIVAKMMRNVSTAFNADMWMSFAGLLQAVSALVGANTAFYYHSHLTTAHLWLALICESSAGKSSVMNFIFQPVADLQYAYNEDYQAAHEEYRKKVMEMERLAKQKDADLQEAQMPEEPRAIKLYAENATFESLIPFLKDNPQGLVWREDELAALIRSFGQYSQAKANPVKAYLLSLHGGNGVNVNRVKEGKQTISIRNAWISLYGTVQGPILPKLVSEDDLVSGFLARFLFVYADRLPPKRHITETANPDLVRNILQGMMSWKRRRPPRRSGKERMAGDPPVIAQLSPEAQCMLEDFYFDLNSQNFYFAQGSQAQRQMQRSRAARWTEQCSRLVLIMHCIERSIAQAPDGGGIIEAGTVRNAIGIFKCLIEHSRAAWDLAFSQKGASTAKTRRVERNEIAIVPFLRKYMRATRDGGIAFFFCHKDAAGTSCFDALVKDLNVVSGEMVTRKALSANLKNIGFSLLRDKNGTVAKISREAFEALLRQNEKVGLPQGEEIDEGI